MRSDHGRRVTQAHNGHPPCPQTMIPWTKLSSYPTKITEAYHNISTTPLDKLSITFEIPFTLEVEQTNNHHGSMALSVPSWAEAACNHSHPRVPQTMHHHKICHILYPGLLSRKTTWLDNQISPPSHGSPPEPPAQVWPNKLSSLAILQCTLKLSCYYYYYYYYYSHHQRKM